MFLLSELNRCHFSKVGLFEVTNLQNVFVLDIEGTTTPISFVTEVLFPYAKENVGNYLRSTYNNAETLHDIRLLRDQVQIYTLHHIKSYVCRYCVLTE